ncbi:MAG: DNA polymerase III subunit delta, partial [Parabacteroides sp.]
NVFEIMDELSKGERDIAQNVNSKMVFFDIALKLTRLVKQ